MTQQHIAAIQQAERDITRALQQLERETGRAVTAVTIHERQSIGGLTTRAIQVELVAGPAEWHGI